MSLKKLALPLFLFSGTIIAFVVSLASQNSDYSSTSSSTTKTSTSSTQQKVDQAASTPAQLQKLSVLPLRCIGCGKCARIDPAHFEMINRVSTVISSTNLNASNLTLAINNCPAQAIVLE